MQLEADLELPAGIIHKWRQRYKGQGQAAFVGKGHQGELEAEIKRLRRELEVARQERDISEKLRLLADFLPMKNVST